MPVTVPLVTQVAPPPPPAGLIARPRLFARLDAGAADEVTLVCGPLGSGKTSLLGAWLAGGVRAAWLTVTPAEDDPVRLWTGVVAAFRATDPDAPVAALDPSREDFLTCLVNALAAAPERPVLVLDDAHLLGSRACRQQLGFVLAHTPGCLRVVLSTRGEPLLHDARLRGRCTEIAAGDLAFTQAETAELLATHGVELAPTLVAELQQRTEGWAAALRFAARSLAAGEDPERFVAEFAGDDADVADYLSHELLALQAPRHRHFLLRTACVDRICGELADTLTLGSDGHDTLSELRRANGLVVALDRRRHWYRYHGLLAQLLQARAAQELGDELGVLQGRAARWYMRAGEPEEAVRHALAGADWELAGELLGQGWVGLLARCGPAPVDALLARLPAERIAADAELATALACVRLELGLTADGAPGAFPALLRARHRGDLPAAAEAAGRLRRDRAGDDALEAVLEFNVGAAALWSRQLETAEDYLTRARERSLDHVTTLALGHLALLALWRTGPEAAAAPARAGIERGGDAAAPALVAAAAGALCGLRTDEAGAYRDRALALGADRRDPQVSAVLAAGAFDAGATADARGLLAAGRPDDALERLAAVGATERAAAFSGTRIALIVLEALALDALERTALADDGLEAALEAAETSGHRAVLIEGGARMAAMLRRRIRAGTQHRAIAGEVLDALAGGDGTRRSRAVLLEPLSERELTVLRYLPTFLPTREIASELFVSPNTIKSHLRSIYRKLDAGSRREAIDRARDLRLLSSSGWR